MSSPTSRSHRTDVLRQHIEDEIRRIDQLRAAYEKRLDERWRAQQEAISKSEQQLTNTLIGFPQSYALKAELERLREDIARIRQDHVQRSEFEAIEAAIARIDAVLAQIAGRGVGISNLSDLVFKTIPILVAIVSVVAAIYFATGR